MAPERAPVDLELVSAVDVFGSVEFQEDSLPREGYVKVIGAPQFAKVVAAGVLGRITITCIEWAGEGMQDTILVGTHLTARIAPNLFQSPGFGGNYRWSRDIHNRCRQLCGATSRGQRFPWDPSRYRYLREQAKRRGLPGYRSTLCDSRQVDHHQRSAETTKTVVLPRIKDLDRYCAARVIDGPGMLLLVK